MLGRLKDAGYAAQAGIEFEWFNFRETPQSLAEKNFASIEPLTPGMFGYSLLRAGLNSSFFNDIMDQLAGFGVPLEGLHYGDWPRHVRGRHPAFGPA